MLSILKDEYLLKPFVEKTLFLHTRFGLTPNNITLINALIVSPLIFIAYETSFPIAMILTYVRCVLDGSDGMIARKYSLSTPEGEHYDHISDILFITTGLTYIVIKLKIILLLPLVYIVGVLAMLVNYSRDKFWKNLGKSMVGVGGGYDSYCVLIYTVYTMIVYCVKDW